ncbi:hypothetical protein NU10_11175 [Flavobacterium dauae]|uniref:hypothetical protein n=1 Tax=Flavobacterium dauae TaxID=1563479 RepID=UPI00101B2D2F|nr:hypothetical protein [Flavobacterium dauae]WLD23264.1 hypothetical protein NU10_11175 [Flavobacterium dauae]
MKKALLIVISLLFIDQLQAQNIRDTVFNDVILIKSTDVSTNGFHFLVDIPIKPQKEPIIIFNDDFRIPEKLFFSRSSFLSEQNEFILITPDWEFHKEIIEEQKKYGIHIKAFPKNKIYQVKRSGSGYKVDSLSVGLLDSGKPIKINFKNPELKENEVKYFFKECYGSTCCPEDPSWKFEKERSEMRNNFNERYKVNAYKNTYRQTRGKEGEHCDYYTLSDLNNVQKIEFLFPPKSYTETDDVTQGFFVIILPSVINTENMKNLHP